MSNNLRFLLIIFSIVLFITMLNLLSKNKVPVRYSLLWIISSILIFVVGAFPNFIGMFTSMIGFQTTSNLVIGIILTILLVITLLLTLIVSGQKRKIKLLIQEVSMIKSDKRD